MTIAHSLMQKRIDFVGIFDSCYIAILLILLGIVLMPMTMTLYNIFNETDEVLKLKSKSGKSHRDDDHDVEAENKPRLSPGEAYTFIYGKREPVWRAIFASFF